MFTSCLIFTKGNWLFFPCKMFISHLKAFIWKYSSFFTTAQNISTIIIVKIDV